MIHQHRHQHQHQHSQLRWLFFMFFGLPFLYLQIHCGSIPAQEPHANQEQAKHQTDTGVTERQTRPDVAERRPEPQRENRERPQCCELEPDATLPLDGAKETRPEHIREGTSEQSTGPFPENPADTPTPPGTWVGLTYHRSDGNRWVSGRGQIKGTKRLNITLTGTPSWLVGVPWRGGSAWAVALSDGRIEAFHLVGQKAQKLQLNASKLPAGMPPVLVAEGGRLRLLTPPTAQASPLTHPVPLPGGAQAFIDQGGNLIIWSAGKESGRLALKALPDARLLTDPKGRILLLTDPTNRYAHGVLGDALEAASITLVETSPLLRISKKIAIPGQRVVEGIQPLWADLDGDGTSEIIVTLSDARQGAQLVVYSEAGAIIATSPAIGSGNRWRNQVALAPFGPGGIRELVDVFTPHIGGPTEFFRLQANALKRVAQIAGYTAHVYGSRNLDLGLAGDFNGDARTELLLPTQDRTSLGILQRNATGVRTLATLSLNGQLHSNIAAVSTSQTIIVAAATIGHLHIWY